MRLNKKAVIETYMMLVIFVGLGTFGHYMRANHGWGSLEKTVDTIESPATPEWEVGNKGVGVGGNFK